MSFIMLKMHLAEAELTSLCSLIVTTLDLALRVFCHIVLYIIERFLIPSPGALTKQKTSDFVGF